MPAIEVKGLRKTFRIPRERTTTLAERVVSLFRRCSCQEIESLRGIDLTVERGSFVGIIGRNGAGKSTLLKLIAGVLVPDEGLVRVEGSVCEVLELGLGFSLELTVYENVELYACILGYPRRELKARLDAAIKFAGLQQFRDAKLKSLSTGMITRLGFSAALQADTDILLLDEITAVGDREFQRKCLDTFAGLKERFKTVLLVSHDMAQVTAFCDRVLLLDHGSVITEGPPDEVIARYDLLLQESPRGGPANTDVSHRLPFLVR
jgi:lipopolysaccharide transport system ATP-binding protein